jgi:hypothetical protein
MSAVALSRGRPLRVLGEVVRIDLLSGGLRLEESAGRCSPSILHDLCTASGQTVQTQNYRFPETVPSLSGS